MDRPSEDETLNYQDKFILNMIEFRDKPARVTGDVASGNGLGKGFETRFQRPLLFILHGDSLVPLIGGNVLIQHLVPDVESGGVGNAVLQWGA